MSLSILHQNSNTVSDWHTAIVGAAASQVAIAFSTSDSLATLTSAIVWGKAVSEKGNCSPHRLITRLQRTSRVYLSTTGTELPVATFCPPIIMGNLEEPNFEAKDAIHTNDHVRRVQLSTAAIKRTSPWDTRPSGSDQGHAAIAGRILSVILPFALRSFLHTMQQGLMVDVGSDYGSIRSMSKLKRAELMNDNQKKKRFPALGKLSPDAVDNFHVGKKVIPNRKPHVRDLSDNSKSMST